MWPVADPYQMTGEHPAPKRVRKFSEYCENESSKNSRYLCMRECQLCRVAGNTVSSHMARELLTAISYFLPLPLPFCIIPFCIVRQLCPLPAPVLGPRLAPNTHFIPPLRQHLDSPLCVTHAIHRGQWITVEPADRRQTQLSRNLGIIGQGEIWWMMPRTKRLRV